MDKSHLPTHILLKFHTLSHFFSFVIPLPVTIGKTIGKSQFPFHPLATHSCVCVIAQYSVAQLNCFRTHSQNTGLYHPATIYYNRKCYGLQTSCNFYSNYMYGTENRN